MKLLRRSGFGQLLCTGRSRTVENAHHLQSPKGFDRHQVCHRRSNLPFRARWWAALATVRRTGAGIFSLNPCCYTGEQSHIMFFSRPPQRPSPTSQSDLRCASGRLWLLARTDLTSWRRHVGGGRWDVDGVWEFRASSVPRPGLVGLLALQKPGPKSPALQRERRARAPWKPLLAADRRVPEAVPGRLGKGALQIKLDPRVYKGARRGSRAYPTQQASRAPRRARRRHPGLRRLQLMRRFSGICLRTPLPGRCPALGQRGASLPREGPATHPGGQRSALPWRVLRICEGCSEFRLLQAAGPGAPSQSRLT